MAKYQQEMDSHLARALSLAEQRQEVDNMTLISELVQLRNTVEVQAAQIKDLTTQLMAVHARLDRAPNAVDATKIVNSAELRFNAALSVAENRLNDALTAVKVDTAHQLQAAQNTNSVLLQEFKERYHQTTPPATVPMSSIRPSTPPGPASNNMHASTKRLDALEKNVQELQTQVFTRRPRSDAQRTVKFFENFTRLDEPEKRVAAAASRVTQVAETPTTPLTLPAVEDNQALQSRLEELSQRVLAVEISSNKAIKEQQQGKRLQALSTTAGPNNVSLMKAQQTLGERLRLLEDVVTANNEEEVRDINDLRTKLEELKRVVETLPSPPTLPIAPTRAASTDLPIALMMEDLFEMVEKHEAFFDLYADRVIAVALAIGGGKISDLTPPSIEAVQTCLRDVKRLSTLKTGDVAQHYINRLERRKTKAERSDNREAAKGNKVERSGEDTAKPQGVRTAEETEASKVNDKAEDVEVDEGDKAGNFGCASVQ